MLLACASADGQWIRLQLLVAEIARIELVERRPIPVLLVELLHSVFLISEYDQLVDAQLLDCERLLLELILGLVCSNLFDLTRAGTLTDGINESHNDDHNKKGVIQNSEAQLAAGHAFDVS